MEQSSRIFGYSGIETLPRLTTDWIYGHFSRQRAACIRQYNKFIADGVGEPHRKEFYSGNSGGQILGEDKFVETVFKQMENTSSKPPTVNKIIKSVCSICEINEKELSKPGRQRKVSEARGLVAWFVINKKSATLTSVAKTFQRDLSALSAAARRIEEGRVESKTLRDKLRLIDNSINQA